MPTNDLNSDRQPPKVEVVNIAQLTPDPLNANKGTERGSYMLEASLDSFGAGRSILIDKDGNIIAGNKTHGKAGEMGFDEVIVVETDGRQLVAVKRTDLELGTPQALGLAIADNRVSEINLDWDSLTLGEYENQGVNLLSFWRQEELDEMSVNVEEEEKGDRQPRPKTCQCPECGHIFEI